MDNILSRAINKSYRVYDRMCGMLDNRSVEVLVDEELEVHIKPAKKTILCVSIAYDYGRRNIGLSYEHYHLHHTLLRMGYSLVYFAYDKIKQKFGNEKMSKVLREAVYTYQPEILFYLHFHDWISHDLVREISEESPTTTVIWLTDDQVDYERERPVWELFNLVVTTDQKGYDRRRKEGFNSVFLSQWACNHYLFRKWALPKIYDACFVGRCYGERRAFVDELRQKGIDIRAFGLGWEKGDRLAQSDLVKIFNQSKIVLDMSATSRDSGVSQIKGRVFEAAGCGSLLLTKDSVQIADYFIPGEEIVTYQDANDAAEKIRYYSANENERERIAKNGYERVLKEHTWEKRLSDIFEYALQI